MIKQKSIYSVKQATRMAFDEMPKQFFGYRLIARAKNIMGREGTYDGSIMRKLRLLRQRDAEKYGYRCIDIEQSIYEKTTQLNPVN